MFIYGSFCIEIVWFTFFCIEEEKKIPVFLFKFFFSMSGDFFLNICKSFEIEKYKNELIYY